MEETRLAFAHIYPGSGQAAVHNPFALVINEE